MIKIKMSKRNYSYDEVLYKYNHVYDYVMTEQRDSRECALDSNLHGLNFWYSGKWCRSTGMMRFYYD